MSGGCVLHTTLQLADDVDRALARHPLDLRLIAQLLLEDDALAEPRTVPQLSKDRRLARNANVVLHPWKWTVSFSCFRPSWMAIFGGCEGSFFGHSKRYLLSFFLTNMSLRENTSTVL